MRVDQFANWGADVWFEYTDTALRHANVVTGEVDRLGGGSSHFVDGATDGSYFVWVEMNRNYHEWSINRQDVHGGPIAVLDQGSLPRAMLWNPTLAVDGGRVAFSIDSASPPEHGVAPPQAGSILVRDIQTGEFERFEVGAAVADVSLSGDALSFVSGHVNTEDLPGNYFDSHNVAVVSLEDGSIEAVGDGGQAVAIVGDQLYWDYEPPTQRGFYDTQVLARRLSETTSSEIAPGHPDPYGTLVVGDGLVAWTNQTELVVYDPTTNDVVALLPDDRLRLGAVTIGGGWLVWSGRATSDTSDMLRFYATPLDAFRSAAGWE